MQANIGFSIFWSGNHGGCNVSGTLELEPMPVAGDRVALVAAGEPLPHVGFGGQLRVEQRIVHAGRPGQPGSVDLLLEPVIVDTEIQAQMLRQYFQRGFGLVAD
jgi:hypothetical protein